MEQKKIVVLGAGESGAGAAVLAKVKGFDVFVSDSSAIKEKYKQLLDSYAIRWEEGHHTESEILSANEVIKSPEFPVMHLSYWHCENVIFPLFRRLSLQAGILRLV